MEALSSLLSYIVSCMLTNCQYDSYFPQTWDEMVSSPEKCSEVNEPIKTIYLLLRYGHFSIWVNLHTDFILRYTCVPRLVNFCTENWNRYTSLRRLIYLCTELYGSSMHIYLPL